MKRLLVVVGQLVLVASAVATTPQNMPPPVSSSTAPPAAAGAQAPASSAGTSRAGAAPASTRAYVGPAVVKSWANAAGAAPAAASARPAPKFGATTGADDSSGLRTGTVQTVSQGGSTFNVRGQRLSFDAKQVKVFKDGKPASVHQLRTGANVRFTMDPSDPLKRRVAVIYLD